MNDTIGQRPRCKLAVQINKIPLKILHSSISKLGKQMRANVICFLESHRFTQTWTTARISWVLRDKCKYYKAFKICTKIKQQCHTYYFNSKYIFNSSKDLTKYYENYLLDVHLTLAVGGKECDHRRWETRTSFDKHVELQSSMSRSQVVDHTKVSFNGKLLSVSLEVGSQWNNFISHDQMAGHCIIPHWPVILIPQILGWCASPNILKTKIRHCSRRN